MLGQQKGDEFKCDSNEALRIKLVNNEDEVMENDNAFPPVMSHQVFGDNELIFGYKDLHIQLYYHAGSLLTYLGMKFKEKIPPSVGIPPDPVLPAIIDKIPKDYCTNLDEFTKRLQDEDSFTPMGTKIHEYSRNNRTFEIYQANIDTPRLKTYHERLQTFILWYIDAASYIDMDDEKWNFFLLFEKINKGQTTCFNIAGYLTIYRYYAYPNSFRPRISQMLILPPFQKNGHGSELLDTAIKFYLSDTSAVDITVEDPSEDFVALRDYMDCKYCQKLDAFQKDKLFEGYTDDMAKAAYEKRKINKKQARRVYEILRYQATNKLNSKDYKEYRLDVKRRLNIPFQKQARDLRKLEKVLSEEELVLAVNSSEERLHRLDEAFTELEQEYHRVVLRNLADSRM